MASSSLRDARKKCANPDQSGSRSMAHAGAPQALSSSASTTPVTGFAGELATGRHAREDGLDAA
jgi:hypothetical protein